MNVKACVIYGTVKTPIVAIEIAHTHSVAHLQQNITLMQALHIRKKLNNDSPLKNSPTIACFL